MVVVGLETAAATPAIADLEAQACPPARGRWQGGWNDVAVMLFAGKDGGRWQHSDAGSRGGKRASVPRVFCAEFSSKWQ